MEMNDEEKDEKEDRNRNGIDDAIEPPIPDVAAGTRRLAERLLNNQAMGPTLSGGDIDARWEDAEIRWRRDRGRQHGHPRPERRGRNGQGDRHHLRAR
jgi:hypothetical protein